MTATVEKVTTWADGHGRWHARISFPAGHIQSGTLAEHAARLRAKARRAIRREIAQRDNVGPGWRCQVKLTAQGLTTRNETSSVTFYESDHHLR